MDICHLKSAELEPKLQKYKGRVVLTGDIVKDDSGAYAVFTGKGSSASQMTAAKIMDVIARLRGCDGQAADAVSAYTGKTKDASKLQKNPECWCPPRQKSGQTFKILWFFLNGNLYGHPLAGLLWERHMEKFHWDWDGEHTERRMPVCMYLPGSWSYTKAHTRDPEHGSWRLHCWRGYNHMRHYNLMHKPVPMPQTMKTPDAGRSWQLVGRSWRICQHCKNQVNSKQEVIEQAQKEGTTVHFATLMDLCNFKKKSDWATRSKIHRRTCCTTWRRCGRWLRFVWSFHRAGILRVTHVRRQCSGCDFQTSRMRRTSKWCSVCQYSGKIGRCPSLKKSKIRMSRCLATSFTTQMAKIMEENWRSRGTSLNEFFLSSISGIVMGKTIRRSVIRTWMGKSSKLGMYVRSMETRVFLSDKCGWHQNAWKEAEFGSNVEEIEEKRRNWRTNLISWSRVFGMHSTWMQTDWNSHWTMYKNVRITCFWYYDMEGHAQKCVERYCEVANKEVE